MEKQTTMELRRPPTAVWQPRRRSNGQSSGSGRQQGQQRRQWKWNSFASMSMLLCFCFLLFAASSLSAAFPSLLLVRGDMLVMPDLLSAPLTGLTATQPIRSVFPSMRRLPFSASEAQVALASPTEDGTPASLLRIGTSWAASGTYSVKDRRAKQTLMLWLLKVNGDVSDPLAAPTGPGLLIAGARYYVAVEFCDDGSSMSFQRILFDSFAASNRYPLLLSGMSPNDWSPTWREVNNTALFVVGSTSATIFNGLNLYAFGGGKDVARMMFQERVVPYIGRACRRALVYMTANLGAPDSVLLGGLNGRIRAALESVTNAHGSLQLNYTVFASPTGVGAVDTAYWRNAFLGRVVGTQGLTDEFDSVLIINQGGDETSICNGLRAAELLPKFSFQLAFLDQPSMWPACEGWHTSSNYFSEAPFTATLPGAIWPSSDAFVREFEDMWGSTPTWGAGQMLVSLEQLSITLHHTASLRPADLRAALLSLEGDTSFGKLKMTATGMNEGAECSMLQVDKGVLRIKQSLDVAQFPAQWAWRPIVWQGLGDTTVSAFLALSGIGLCLVGLSTWLLIALRASPVVKAFTLSFTLLIEVGLACAFVSVILQVSVYPVTPYSCRCSIFFAHLSFLLIFGSVFSRSYRILRIWFHKATSSVSLTNRQLLVQLALMTLGLMLYTGLWFGGVGGGTKPGPTLFVQGVRQYSVCGIQGSPWGNALLATEAGVMLGGLYLAIKNRNVPLLFRESSSIALIVYNTAVVAAVAGALVSTVLSSPENSIPLVGAVLLLSAYVIFGVLVVGQLYSVAEVAGWLQKSPPEKRRLDTSEHTALTMTYDPDHPPPPLMPGTQQQSPLEGRGQHQQYQPNHEQRLAPLPLHTIAEQAFPTPPEMEMAAAVQLAQENGIGGTLRARMVMVPGPVPTMMLHANHYPSPLHLHPQHTPEHSPSHPPPPVRVPSPLLPSGPVPSAAAASPHAVRLHLPQEPLSDPLQSSQRSGQQQPLPLHPAQPPRRMQESRQSPSSQQPQTTPPSQQPHSALVSPSQLSSPPTPAVPPLQSSPSRLPRALLVTAVRHRPRHPREDARQSTTDNATTRAGGEGDGDEEYNAASSAAEDGSASIEADDTKSNEALQRAAKQVLPPATS